MPAISAVTAPQTPFAVLASTRLDGGAQFLRPHRVRIGVAVPGVEPVEIIRECTLGGQAVSILPYDPDAKKVLLIEEPCAGALLSGRQNFFGLDRGRCRKRRNDATRGATRIMRRSGR